MHHGAPRCQRVGPACLALLLGAALLLAIGSEASAHGRAMGFGIKIPRATFTVGPSVGFFAARDVMAVSTTVEMSGAYRLFWSAAGLRMAFSNDTTYLLPFVEAGVWFFGSFGIGYSAGFSTGPGSPIPLHNVHLYLGVPVPVFKAKLGRGHLLLVPYYRPSWGSGGGAEGWSHEVGVLFKWRYEVRK
jgi:hypothetical protein